MTTPVEVPFNLDASQYLTVSQQIIQQNQAMMGSIASLSSAGGTVQRAYGSLSPNQDHINRMSTFAQRAADARTELSGLYAAQAAGGANAAKLQQGIQQLSQTLPIGQRGAAAIVETISQLGLGSQGSEKRVSALAKTVGQLQEAVGGSGPELGAGLVQLERTFGDQGVDPKRVRATADSLTTVSHELGASASGVLQFTNLIGPFAQAAGIGKTSALGIAASFSRIGQDGSYAANTVGTLLQGINTAVQEGSPDLAKYANIVGTTANHFQTLFKADPAGTLTKITQALAQSGPQTTMQLQGLGLDSVRSQRSLQALIQSGGLQQGIQTAVGAYGNGSTGRAANAGFNNVEDNFTRAGAAALNLAQNLGAPLLAPLNLFAKTLAGITGGVSNAVGGVLHSRVGGDIANTALMLGGTALLARRIARPFGTIGLGLSALGSQPVRAGLAGFATARYGGDLEAAQGSRLGRLATLGMRPGTTSPFDRYAASGTQEFAGQNWRGDPITRGMMAQRGFQFGAGLGGSRFAAMGMPVAGGPGIMSRVGAFAAAPFEMAQLAFRTQSDTARQARLAMQGRTNQMFPGPEGPGEASTYARGAYRTFGTSVQDSWRAYRGGGSAGDFTSEVRSSFKTLSSEVAGTSKVFGPARAATSAFAGAVMEQARLIGAVGAAGARGVGGGLFGRATFNEAGQMTRRAGLATRGLQGLGGVLGGPAGIASMAGIGAVMGGVWLHNQGQAQRKYENDLASNFDIYGQLNAYREAAGQTTMTSTNASATTATTSGTTAAAAKGVTGAGGAGNFRVTDADVQAATAARSAGKKPAIEYGKKLSSGQLAAQINSMNVNGLSASDAQDVRQGLLEQGYSRNTVNDVMGRVNAVPTQARYAAPGEVGGNATTDVTAGARENVKIRAAPDKNRINWSETTGWTGSVAGMKLDKQATSSLGAVTSQVGQTQQAQANDYGTNYANQEEFRNMNKLVQQSLASGNAFFTRMLIKRFSSMLTGKAQVVNPTQMAQNGGYIQALAAQDPQFKQTLSDLEKGGGTLGTGGLNAKPELSPLAKQMRDIGGPLATYYDNTKLFPGYGQGNPGDLGTVAPASQAQNRARMDTAAYLQQPGNLSLQNTAAESQIAAGQKAGQSLGQLAANAAKAAATINDTSSASYQLSQAVQGLAEQMMQNKAALGSTGQNFGAQSQYNSALANTNINSQQGAADRQKGRLGQEQLLGQSDQMMKQYLQTEMQYQLQSSRAQTQFQNQVGDATKDFQRQQEYGAEDYYRQLGYAQEDYQRSAGRAQQDFLTQQQRAVMQYNIQVERANQDESTTLKRQQRDYQIAMSRGQEDFFTQRSRAIRDFNKQLSREVEDSAQNLYDPYKRIQTQQVWDTKDLLTNLSQQNDAIKKQTGQLSQLRGMGVTDQTIQQLGLNNPANAQQLSQMVSDMLNDPTLVKQVNATAAARMSLGSILVTDPSNKDIARAKADFATSLADMESDYNKSVARARADMAKQVADEEADFAKGMQRMVQDFYIGLVEANQDFGLSMNRAAQDEEIALERMGQAYTTSVDRANQQFETSMSRMARDYSIALSNMRQDVTLSEEEITGSYADIWSAVQKTMSGQQVNWSKLMHGGLNDVLSYIKGHKSDFAGAYQDLVGGDIQSLFPKGGTGGPGAKGDPFAGLFSSLNSKMNSQWPVDDPTITQLYHDPKTGGTHPGMDLAVPTGTPIRAALGGTVVLAGWDDGYGNTVILDHGGGRSTLYGHQERVGVKPGDRVTGGETIGWVDSTGNSTGPHLHFETRQDGHTEDPRQVLPTWMATAGGGKQSPVYHGPFEYLINSAEAMTLLASQRKAANDTLDSPGLHSTPGIEKYRPVAESVARALGWANGAPYIMAQMATEDSSGDPAAVNKWDSNWAKGVPSVGLMQVIGPTYQSWKPHPDSGPYLYGTSIDPRSNIWAGTNYALHQYPGDPQHGMGYGHGYFQGGIADRPTKINGVFGEAAKEALIPLDTRGAQVMAEAFRRALGPDDVRAMLVAGHASPVTYHYETHTTDASTRIEGPVTVQSQDPNDMLRKIAAKKHADRLVPSGRP